MQKVLFIFLIVFSCTWLKAQINQDSLYLVWLDQTQSDSLRTVAYEAYIYNGYMRTDPDSVILLADELIDFGIERSYDEAWSFGLELKGYAYYEQGNYTRALKYFNDALAIAESTDREKHKGSLMNTIGVLYGTLGNEARALEYYERALKAGEEVNDLETMEMCVSNIGEIYFALGNYPRALEYLERGLQLEKEMGDSIGYALSLNLIAGVFRKQHDFIHALEHSEKAMKIHKKFNYTEGIADCFFSIGQTYKEQKKFSLAIQYFNQGLEFNIGRDSSEFHVESLNMIGITNIELGDYTRALHYCKLSKELASKLEMLGQLKEACECLYLAYRKLNMGNYALNNLEQVRMIDDSLNIQETNNRLQQMEIEKQALEDSIATAEKERLINLAHQEEVRKKNRTKNIALGTGLLLLLLAGAFFSRWRYVKRSKAIIEKEKERSENLLLNILPAEIAEELKIKGSADARDFDQVSILFTDFKEFTKLSEKLSAKELVAKINQCFKEFDRICEKHAIEKIKTIGDAYMAAGGLPVPADDSVTNTILAALEMQDFITEIKLESDASGIPAFEMRVGIHTGPVVAGIVGIKKFQYDIWGDTVNTASRIESNGEVGKVNISQTSYNLLKHDPRFVFESRGKIEAKGKGEIEMYFVKLRTKN